MFEAIRKPWFVYQPGQLVRRVIFGVRGNSRGLRHLKTSWGGSLLADSSRVVGTSIAMTGVFDLAVTEALVRLVDAGDTVVDAGANIGYMSALLARAIGSTGHLLAFEPHPELFQVLEQNLAGPNAGGCTVRLYRAALGAEQGSGFLLVPDDFNQNDGLSHMSATAGARGTSLEVEVDTLDRLVGDAYVHALKLDVEGYEPQVLKGAVRLLRDRRLRHIIFEDHAVTQSAVVETLRTAGYTIYALGWSLHGPELGPSTLATARRYEAPSFLATLDPAGAVRRMQPRGWQALSVIVPRQRQELVR